MVMPPLTDLLFLAAAFVLALATASRLRRLALRSLTGRGYGKRWRATRSGSRSTGHCSAIDSVGRRGTK